MIKVYWDIAPGAGKTVDSTAMPPMCNKAASAQVLLSTCHLWLE